MQRVKVYIFFAAAVCFVWFNCLSAAALGLKVAPGRIDLKGVPLGERVAVSGLADRPVCLKIENTGNRRHDYRINVLYTADTNAPLAKGYSDIPDTAWIKPGFREVNIVANSSKEVELYLEIPENQEYAGKKYQAIIEVKSKKDHPQEVFVVAAQVRVRFETE